MNEPEHIYLFLAVNIIGLSAFLFLFIRYRRINVVRHRQDEKLAAERDRLLRSQSELEETQALYKQLVESARDIIYETNFLGRITYANPVAERIMGFPHDVLLSKRYIDFVDPEWRAGTVKFYRQQLRDRTPNTYREFPVTTGDGKRLWLGQNAQIVMRKGRPVAFQAVARDITALKTASDELSLRDARMQEDLEMAQHIHQALLPIRAPTLEGFDFGLRVVPFSGLGGDFINFIRFPDHTRLGVVFADITGHGVAAAMLSTMLKVLVDEVMQSGRSPAECFRILNRRLAIEYPEGNFASAIYAIFDAADCSMTYVKASQEPAIVVRADGETTVLEKGGPALGLIHPDVFEEPEYEEMRVPLHAGDTVFFYTDGLVEVGPSVDQFISADTLSEWLREARRLPAQSFVEQIYSQSRAQAHSLDLLDDIATMAVRVE
jgi:PAS domain S-box-containing protein